MRSGIRQLAEIGTARRRGSDGVNLSIGFANRAMNAAVLGNRRLKRHLNLSASSTGKWSKFGMHFPGVGNRRWAVGCPVLISDAYRKNKKPKVGERAGRAMVLGPPELFTIAY